jgi:hypothetical protein
LDLASNDIGNFSGTGASKIALEVLGEALKSNTILTELNVSANKIKGRDIQGLANGIKDNGAMTSLDVSNNSLGVAAGWEFSSGQWWLNGDYPPGHSDSNPCSWLPAAGSDISGVILLADAIKNNGTLTSLNLSSNSLKAAGAKIMAGAIKVTNCGIAVVLVPYLCLSDQLNCCCLLLSTG